MRKFLLALAISLSFIGNVEAAELYDVIHREVSYFNASDRESAWITQRFCMRRVNIKSTLF